MLIGAQRAAQELRGSPLGADEHRQEGCAATLTQNVALLRQVFLLVFLRTYRPPKGVKKIWLKQ